MVTKRSSKVEGTQAVKARKPRPTLKKANTKARSKKSTLEVERSGALARVYAWLAADLGEWQTTHGGAGAETEGDCPVVVQLHNEACRAFHDSELDLAEATEVASAVLTVNTQGKEYVDPVTKEHFVFREAEIKALTTLMMDDTFLALAPYSPLGMLEMW